MNAIFRALCTLPLTVALSYSASAAIGEIGSPNVITSSNAQQKPASSQPVEVAASQPVASSSNIAATPEPLLTVRFNKHHVNYNRMLRVAVEETKSRKSNAKFTVISYLPEAQTRSGTKRIMQKARMQQADFLEDLGKEGVKRNQIQHSVQTSADVQHHELYLYVR